MEDENKDALITQLLEQYADLANKVRKLESSNKLPSDLPDPMQMSKSLESGSFFLPMPTKLKRGMGSIPLLESDILEAQEKSISATDAARKMGVNYQTFRKYAKMYGIFERKLNPRRIGVSRNNSNPNRGKYPLLEILAGKFPEYPIFRLKDKLIRSKVKPMSCEQCGFHEKRITDGKIPLLLVFEDGNSKNHKLENIKLFCYNCAFTSGKLWTKYKDRSKWLNNPDRILGASKDTKQVC